MGFGSGLWETEATTREKHNPGLGRKEGLEHIRRGNRGEAKKQTNKLARLFSIFL